MVSMMHQKNMNEFIITFLTEYAPSSLERWRSEENQTNFLNIINKIAKKSKASGKKKTEKDPNKPKRGMSAYIFFCGETRPKIKKENPNINTRDLTAELGVRWARLKENNPKDVKKYSEMAAADKERYDREMENYVPSDESDESDEKKKTGKKKKDSSKPKRGRSAYIFFCLEKRAVILQENPEITPKEIMSELSARWNTLKTENEQEFQRFTELARQDKIRYQSEMSNSEDSEINNAKVPKVQKKSKVTETQEEEKKEEEEEEKKEEHSEENSEETEDKVPKSKKSNKKMSKSTGYIVFCKEKRAEVKAENPDMKASEVTKELSKMWKEMSDADKNIYIEKAN